MSIFTQPWKSASFVAIDLETTGRYPIESEICEIAGLKWKNGQIIDRYQSLVKPLRPMSNEVIAIHNITNEMVVDAPALGEVLQDFHKFISDSVTVAHHAPFDMGFLSLEFEKAGLSFPAQPSLCTSIISRKAVPKSANHRLTTLIEYFQLDKGQLHRAFDDANSCLEVALKCFEIIGPDKTLEELYRFQGKSLYWDDYSILDLEQSEIYGPMVTAAKKQGLMSLVYEGGSRPGTARNVFAIGIVRNPDGDFLVAKEENQEQVRRYYLDKIKEVSLIDDETI